MELKYSKKFVRQLKQYKHDDKLFQILGKKLRHIQSAADIDELTELVSIRKTTAQ